RANAWFTRFGRPAQRGFQSLRHLGEVLIGARQRRSRNRRRHRGRGWRRSSGTFGADRRRLRALLSCRTRHHRFVARCPWRDEWRVARFRARREWFRREVRKRIAATLEARLRRAANLVGKGRTRKLLGRLGHLRIGMLEGVRSGAIAVVPTAVR